MKPEDPATPERQVAERVFEIAPRTYRIPLPTGFPLGDVNTYFLDGAQPTLIDAGVAGDAALNALEGALSTLGRTAGDLRLILLTHAHVDHAGNIEMLRRRSGCTVRILARGIPRLQDIEGHFLRTLPGFLDYLARCGFNHDTVDKYAGMARMFIRYGRSCPDLAPLADGEDLDLGDRRLKALWRPGHSSVDTIFLQADTGVLFTGDHVLPNITSNPTLEAPEPGDDGRYHALVRYRDSLARTARIEARVACPGHGRPFTDLARRCEELLEHQDRRCRRVLKIIREGGAMTRKDVSMALFGRVRLWDIFLTLSEVQGAIEALELEGSVRTWNDGVVDRVETVPGASA